MHKRQVVIFLCCIYADIAKDRGAGSAQQSCNLLDTRLLTVKSGDLS